MPGQTPLSTERKDEIAAAIRRDPVPTQRALANEFGVSVSTIYRVAADYDLADAWEHRRHRTEAATASRAVDVAAKRQRLEELALDTAAEFLHNRANRVQQAIKGMEGVDVVETEPSHHEWKALGQAVQSLSAAAVGFARLETELAGAGTASGILDDIEAGLREARQRREAASRTGEDV